MGKAIRCGECKQKLTKGERLKSHWRAEHIEKFMQIRLWLGEDRNKLKAAEILAKEGMQSEFGQARPGVHARQTEHESRRQQAKYVKQTNEQGVNEDDSLPYPEEEEK